MEITPLFFLQEDKHSETYASNAMETSISLEKISLSRLRKYTIHNNCITITQKRNYSYIYSKYLVLKWNKKNQEETSILWTSQTRCLLSSH